MLEWFLSLPPSTMMLLGAVTLGPVLCLMEMLWTLASGGSPRQRR